MVLISGAPKYDNQVAEIANTLKTVTNHNIALWGVIGSSHEALFSKILASSNLLDNNEFEVTRAYNTYHENIQDSILPYRMLTHYRNHCLMKVLKQNNFGDEIFRNKVSAIATVGNFSLSLRIGEYLNQVALS